MILYFSTTGNCKYVATKISQATNDKIISIEDCIKKGNYNFTDNCIGIISPTYFWALPSITREFLQKVKLQADYLYYVATYGTSPGASDFYAEKFLGKKLNASFSVRMPDTWTPFFDLSTPEKIAGFSKSTESEIKSIIEHLQQKDCGHFMDNSKSKMTTKIAYSLYESMRKTKVHGQYTNPNVKI
ncbi:MAG: EFR1 family ferrodoxin [Treponema sp.]|nr:EFR1 family ferrodoxin [Treponema sp.]